MDKSIQKAINIIKESRLTHIEWQRYFDKHPREENHERFKTLGGSQFHKEMVRNYDFVLAQLIDITLLREALEKIVIITDSEIAKAALRGED